MVVRKKSLSVYSLSETLEITRSQVEQCLKRTLLKTSSVESEDYFQVIHNIDE